MSPAHFVFARPFFNRGKTTFALHQHINSLNSTKSVEHLYQNLLLPKYVLVHAQTSVRDAHRPTPAQETSET
jgi:hypothetical protein